MLDYLGNYNLLILEIKISSKVQNLVTRVAIIPIVEFGERISSKVHNLATRIAIISIGSSAKFWKQRYHPRLKIWPLDLL